MASAYKTMQEKLTIAHPYNIFYNTIPQIPATLQKDNAISFSDLLCESLGELENSLHIVSKIDLEWLMEQYRKKGYENKPMTLLYGEEKPEIEKLILSKYKNVTTYNVAVHDRFASHHCRISIFIYNNSLRVVISSANLHQDHWTKYNNCFWVSPACPPLAANAPTSAGDSATNFRQDLVIFLKQYHLPILDSWIKRIASADFREVKVFLITSYPDAQGGSEQAMHLVQTRKILSQHCNTQEIENWPILIQTSVLGTYLKGVKFWLGPYLLRALSGKGKNQQDTNVPFCIIYPTRTQVKYSLFGEESGKTFRYARKIHNLQRWLMKFMYRWKSVEPERTKVLPKHKLYTRVSPDYKQMAWFLLTSANATRGAWGTMNQPMSAHNLNVQGPLYMRNYEMGVLFIPLFFGEDCFKIGKNGFPLPISLPLEKYERDEPWTTIRVDPPKQKFQRFVNEPSTDWC